MEFRKKRTLGVLEKEAVGLSTGPKPNPGVVCACFLASRVVLCWQSKFQINEIRQREISKFLARFDLVFGNEILT